MRQMDRLNKIATWICVVLLLGLIGWLVWLGINSAQSRKPNSEDVWMSALIENKRNEPKQRTATMPPLGKTNIKVYAASQRVNTEDER